MQLVKNIKAIQHTLKSHKTLLSLFFYGIKMYLLHVLYFIVAFGSSLCALFFTSLHSFVFGLHKSVNIICMHAVHWMQLIILRPPCLWYHSDPLHKKEKNSSNSLLLRILRWKIEDCPLDDGPSISCISYRNQIELKTNQDRNDRWIDDQYFFLS